MPLFESASNLQINGGNFLDIAGDLNLIVSRPTIDDRVADPLDSLEFTFGDDGTSCRRLTGADGNGAARMLPGEAFPNVSPFSYPDHERKPSAPSLVRPAEIAETERYLIPRRLDAAGSSSQPPRIRVIAPTPRTPPIENNRPPLSNYLSADLEQFAGPVGGNYQPLSSAKCVLREVRRE
ncbi:hypothetical protein DFH06DRAFT_1121580 [Mycena polygramma]|nr:hypothetical protein DFH06DRAFT_1121580 [Mycena polygramma]